ncbi:hypothetical protein KAW80_04115 [Candidatus Babeliales bacterium]|nr:hypothetical protein [Candidatus Babeliales bacterium]
MKKGIYLIIGLFLLTIHIIQNLLLAVGPIPIAIPLIGGALGAGGLSKIPGNLAEVLSNAQVTMVIIQILSIVVLLISVIWSASQINLYFKNRKKNSFLFLLNRLELEILSENSPTDESVSLFNDHMGIFVVKWLIPANNQKKMHQALKVLQQAELTKTDKVMIISALKDAVKLI